MVKVIDKVNNVNIYDGCLSYLREYLTAEIPYGRQWRMSGIKNLVGCETAINEHLTPYNSPPAFYKIFFGNYYIKPISYSLMGRRIAQYNEHYIKGWDFYGRNKNNEWIILSSLNNEVFTFGSIKNYEITDANDVYNAFMIKMNQPDDQNHWALCIGQIEVFGYIFDSIPTNQQEKIVNSKVNYSHFLFTLLNSH